jgi:hypothetical protein
MISTGKREERRNSRRGLRRMEGRKLKICTAENH